MSDYILQDVRTVCKVEQDDNSFDEELILATNAILMAMEQIGIGRPDFYVTSDEDRWDDFLIGREPPGVRQLVGLRVSMIFDPPANGTLKEAKEAMIAELEFRLNISMDYLRKEETP